LKIWEINARKSPESKIVTMAIAKDGAAVLPMRSAG
jgi:hypothetical protein